MRLSLHFFWLVVQLQKRFFLTKNARYQIVQRRHTSAPPPFSSSSILPLFILVLHPSPPCGNSEALLPFFPCNATKQGLLRLEIPAVAAGVLPLMEEKKDVPRIRDSEGCKNRM